MHLNGWQTIAFFVGMMPTRSMIVVAGGSGTRMGSELPKQFIELEGKPILMHTMEAVRSMDAEMQIILVLPESQLDFWEKLCSEHNWRVPHLLAKGGATRFLSVKSGLAQATGNLIGIHDGVRPFISKEMVNRCFDAAEKEGAAVPVVPIVQSLRRVLEDRNSAVNRDDFRAVQTPQCFKATVLNEAFEVADRTDYSDDASVVEASGTPISLVDGDQQNIKVTTPFDLQLARLIIEGRKQSA
jgi:2-C-methyl-D-erythritol 4-phosphate cytidylyltransferase